ncbi:hypothetical protein GQX74_012919 [Glossina fuscipes]|nr:hypothetical protein GQX74_012919 [Glossina fuscipes]
MKIENKYINTAQTQVTNTDTGNLSILDNNFTTSLLSHNHEHEAVTSQFTQLNGLALRHHRLPVEGVLAAFGGTPCPPGVTVVRGTPGNTEDCATWPPPLPVPPPPGPADARPAEELAVLYGVAGDTERAPGGTVDVTAIALATVGVVRLAVDDGTALVVKFVGCTC